MGDDALSIGSEDMADLMIMMGDPGGDEESELMEVEHFRLGEFQIPSRALSRLEANDPSLKVLCICRPFSTSTRHHRSDTYWPWDAEDWTRLANAISKNTELECIELKDINENNLSTASLGAFARGFSQNRSILTLKCLGCFFRDGWLFESLTYCAEKNNRIQALHLSHGCVLGSVACRVLSYFIKDAANLKQLSIDFNIAKVRKEELLSSFISLPQLEALSFSGMTIGISTALGSLLKDRLPNINSLELHFDEVCDDGVKVIFPSLVGNRVLTRLDFGSNCMTQEGWNSFFSFLESSNITDLNLEGCNLCSSGIKYLSHYLAIGKWLTRLNLCDLRNSESISLESWSSLSRALSHCHLKELQLLGNVFNYRDREVLCDGLAMSTSLEDLALESNFSFESRGAISKVLASSHSKLKRIHLSFIELYDDDLPVIAEGMKSNKRLRFMTIEMKDMGNKTMDLKSFELLICDNSTINATYYSNHNLEYLSILGYNPDMALHPKLTSMLELNCDPNKKYVADMKVFMVHFVGNFSLDEFEDMNLVVLSRILGWIGMAMANTIWSKTQRLSAVYRLLKSRPTLVGVPKDKRRT